MHVNLTGSNTTVEATDALYREGNDEDQMTKGSLSMAWYGVARAMFFVYIGAALALAYGTVDALIGLALTIVASGLINRVLSKYAIHYAVFEGSIVAYAFQVTFGGEMWMWYPIVVFVSQTRINTAHYYLGAANLKSFGERVFRVKLPNLVWVLTSSVIIFLLMLLPIVKYILLALAWQGVRVTAWVAIAVTHILITRGQSHEHGMLADVHYRRFNNSGLIAWIVATLTGIVMLQLGLFNADLAGVGATWGPILTAVVASAVYAVRFLLLIAEVNEAKREEARCLSLNRIEVELQKRFNLAQSIVERIAVNEQGATGLRWLCVIVEIRAQRLQQRTGAFRVLIHKRGQQLACGFLRTSPGRGGDHGAESQFGSELGSVYALHQLQRVHDGKSQLEQAEHRALEYQWLPIMDAQQPVGDGLKVIARILGEGHQSVPELGDPHGVEHLVERHAQLPGRRRKFPAHISDQNGCLDPGIQPNVLKGFTHIEVGRLFPRLTGEHKTLDLLLATGIHEDGPIELQGDDGGDRAEKGGEGTTAVRFPDRQTARIVETHREGNTEHTRLRFCSRSRRPGGQGGILRYNRAVGVVYGQRRLDDAVNGREQGDDLGVLVRQAGAFVCQSPAAVHHSKALGVHDALDIAVHLKRGNSCGHFQQGNIALGAGRDQTGRKCAMGHTGCENNR
ncbi:CheY-like chemotaxis protein [Cryobacterium sp. CAN_C3]|nr:MULTISPECIES: hypothetical protein [unclassified Cryobacterium]MEC5154317.1 CheY-like chemotaxis protein [Cryobacterium sp. CAN_C3]